MCVFSGKFSIGQPFARDISGQLRKPDGIVDWLFAVVVTEDLLIEVTEQMKRLHAHIGSIDAAFQEAPEVLDTIGMDASVDVGLGVVDHHVDIHRIKPLVGTKGIVVYGGSGFDMSLHVFLKHFLFAVCDHGTTELSTALQKPDNGSLVLSSGAGDSYCPLTVVHIPGLAAYEGFVHFYLGSAAAHLDERSGLHSETDAMEHEPCGFLGDSKSPRQLVGTDSVFAISDHPHSHKPLFQADGGILEDGPDLDAELLAGMLLLAFPYVPGSDEANVFPSAGRAFNAVGPALRRDVGNANLWIGEVANCVL